MKTTDLFVQGDQGYCYLPYAYLLNPHLSPDIQAIQSPSVRNLHNRHLINQEQIFFGSAKPASTAEDEKRESKLEIIEETDEDQTKTEIDQAQRTKIVHEAPMADRPKPQHPDEKSLFLPA